MVIIDIGAHVGNFIDLYPEATVYAFEPNPVNYEFLVAKYKDKKNVHLYQMAVSYQDGDVTLYRAPDDDSGMGSTGRSCIASSNKNVSKDKYWQVKSTRLSTFLHENDINDIDILKIDAEGAEYEIIEDLIKGNCLRKIREILYEDHSFLFDHEYVENARCWTVRLYQKFANPHYINFGNKVSEWTSEVPYVKWRLEFPPE